jgi:hypothetical protein
MKPFVIVDRATVEAEVGLCGYDSSNVCLGPQENAFMTTRLFELWAREVFFPAVAQRRAEFGYTGRALLLLDGLGSHHTDEFLQTCASQNIDVLFLIPHSSDQTQPLDVLAFALMKRHFSGSRFSPLENPQSNRLVRILGAWSESSAPDHNIEAFVGTGQVPFEEALRFGEYYLRVQGAAARCLRRWPGLDDGGDRAPLQPEGRRRVRLPTGKYPLTTPSWMIAGMVEIGRGYRRGDNCVDKEGKLRAMESVSVGKSSKKKKKARKCGPGGPIVGGGDLRPPQFRPEV